MLDSPFQTPGNRLWQGNCSTGLSTYRAWPVGRRDLARLVDRRGFARYRVAEHHSVPGVTTSSPPMLLARLAGEARRIRLGAGGMMLPNFPPLVVAEQFGLLASMAPGRVDPGIGLAPGTDMTAAATLRRGQIGTGAFPSQLCQASGIAIPMAGG